MTYFHPGSVSVCPAPAGVMNAKLSQTSVLASAYNANSEQTRCTQEEGPLNQGTVSIEPRFIFLLHPLLNIRRRDFGRILSFPKLKLRATIIPLPRTSAWLAARLSTGCVFTAWFLIKNRDTFTLYRDSSVGMALGYGLDERCSRV
jgi:hypothetical protein